MAASVALLTGATATILLSPTTARAQTATPDSGCDFGIPSVIELTVAARDGGTGAPISDAVFQAEGPTLTAAPYSYPPVSGTALRTYERTLLAVQMYDSDAASLLGSIAAAEQAEDAADAAVDAAVAAGDTAGAQIAIAERFFWATQVIERKVVYQDWLQTSTRPDPAAALATLEADPSWVANRAPVYSSPLVITTAADGRTAPAAAFGDSSFLVRSMSAPDGYRALDEPAAITTLGGDAVHGISTDRGSVAFDGCAWVPSARRVSADDPATGSAVMRYTLALDFTPLDPSTPPTSAPPSSDPPVTSSPSGSTSSTSPANDPDTGPSFVSTPGTVARGTHATVVATGFAAGEMVDGVMHSTPLALGSRLADADGVVRFTWLVPSNTPLGVHSVELEGQTSGTISAQLTVTDAARLAATGRDSQAVSVAIAAVSVALLGALGVGVARPRSSPTGRQTRPTGFSRSR